MDSVKKQESPFSYQTSDFKPKLVRKDKEGHFILLKGSIKQQDKTILNIYAPNNGVSMYIKRILLSILRIK